MALITSTGVGSGLDVSSIVTGLMSVEKQSLTRLQTQAGSYQTQISAYGSLQGQLSTLADTARRLAAADAWNPMQADSSDSASVGASATSAAAAGAHTVEVQKLAQPQVLATGYLASSATVVGTGTLVLDVGTTSGSTFTARAGTSPVSITIDAAHQTLAGIRDAINAAGAGVTASILTGSAGARLVLRTLEGADSSVRLQVTDADGGSTDASGLSMLAWDPAQPAGAGANLTQSLAPQDAQFAIDGVPLTSASNTVTSALDGVTLTLRKTTSAPVQLSTTVQSTAVRKNVNDFVNAWNSLNTLLRNQTQVDPSGKSNGVLQGDSAAVSVLQSMRSMLQGSVGGLAGVASLSSAGIQLQADGSLAVNDGKLAPLLAAPKQLAALFTQAQAGTDASTRGFAVRFRDWAAALGADGGTLASRVAGLKSRVTDNQKRQDSEQARLDRVETALRTQYQRLDATMSNMNGELARMKSALGLA